MHFTGQIFFGFDTYDVWRIYALLLRASQDKRVTVAVEWRPFLADDLEDGADPPNRVLALAASEAVRSATPAEYDKFVRALLTMAYQEKDDPGSKKILAVAAHVAGIDGDAVIARAFDPGLDLLQRATDAARELGVSKVADHCAARPSCLHQDDRGCQLRRPGCPSRTDQRHAR